MTNQTIDGVPRELLERLLTLAAMSASAPYRELRALLDDEECCHEFVPFQASCTKCGIPYKPAAQPQGEPVALFDTGKNIDERRTFGSVQTCTIAPMIHDFARRLDDGLTADGRPYAPPINMHSRPQETPHLAGEWQAMNELRQIFDSNNGADVTLVISKTLAAQLLRIK